MIGIIISFDKIIKHCLSLFKKIKKILIHEKKYTCL